MRWLLGSLALVLVAVACTSEATVPADADEFRERLDAALHAEPERVLHLQFSLPAADGGFELDRETWVDWRADAYRHAYYGNGDEASLTLIVDDRRYYPPATEPQPVENRTGGIVLESLEVLQIPFGILRFTDGTAAVVEADLDGDRVWRLEQAGVRAIEGDEQLFCIDVQFDIDAETELPSRFTTAECGSPISVSYLYAVEWLDRADVPEGFFTPETAADFETAP